MKWLLMTMSSLVLLLASVPAMAHKASDGFVYLDQREANQTVRIDLAVRDLALVVALDRNRDQQVTGAELNQARADITRYIEQGLTLLSSAGNCQLAGDQWGMTRHSDGPYASALYRIDCPQGAVATTLRYTLLFEVDSLHRGLIQRISTDGEQLASLSPDDNSLPLTGAATPLWKTFGDFLWQGVVHLILGFDHVLFLLVLILPATLRNNEAGNADRTTLKQRLWQLAGIVSAFTVAHSITLGLAALNILQPPIAWIEIIIALSIALAALNLFFPVLGRKTWKLAFGFGLIHGFGFASVLSDLASGTSQKVTALAGFNMGVELGQLALVALAFPLLYLMGSQRLYQRAGVPVMALVVSIIALYWAAERFAGLPAM